jgi:tetratricopeptide (TPR) repeat protein
MILVVAATSASILVALSLGLAEPSNFKGKGTQSSTPSVQEVQHGCRESAKAQHLFDQGLALKKRGAIDKAIAIYKKIIREFPTEGYDDAISEGCRLYADDAREHLDELHCLKTRGPDFSSSSRDKIITAVREAFQSKKVSALARYASCGFIVSVWETDAAWSTQPDRVMHLLIELEPRLDWSTLSFEAERYAILKDKSNSEKHVFEIQAVSGQWRWTGYATTDDKFFQRLIKKVEGKK